METKPCALSSSFIPEIDEPSLIKEDVNVGVIPGRRQLFNGKTFLFLTAKQVGLFCLCDVMQSCSSRCLSRVIRIFTARGCNITTVEQT